MVARRGDTILMNERDWEDIKRWSEGDVRKVPTPDKVWKELLRRAPKTAARSKSFKEWRGLVDYICEVHRDAQQASDALQAGNKRYDELQRAYLEDKAIMVELARAFANVLQVTERMDYVECKLPFELIREFLERTRPLVVEAGSDELKGKAAIFNPSTFELGMKKLYPDRNSESQARASAHEADMMGRNMANAYQQELMAQFAKQGMVSRETVLKSMGISPNPGSARKNIARGLGVPEEFLDPNIPNKEK